jgi:hypothetical protein
MRASLDARAFGEMGVLGFYGFADRKMQSRRQADSVFTLRWPSRKLDRLFGRSKQDH